MYNIVVKENEMPIRQKDGEKMDNARIIDITTGEVIAEVITNQSMDLDTALDFAGATVINNEDDPRWSDDEGNIILNGKRYDWDNLTLE